MTKSLILEEIEIWDEIIENFESFNSSIKTSPSVARDRLSSFYHWYYLPSDEIFAPSKFLGYKGMTLSRYEGEGTGAETQKALNPYFIKLDRESTEYDSLLTKLEAFLESMGKKISKRTTSGSGGIHIPKSD